MLFSSGLIALAAVALARRSDTPLRGSTVSSASFAAAFKSDFLDRNARSVLAIGGTEALGEWWREGFTVVHAAMGDSFRRLVNARGLSAQVIDWEPCSAASHPHGMQPMPFGRWAFDAVVLTGRACFDDEIKGRNLAFEIDRILRPGGVLLSLTAALDRSSMPLVTLEATAGWPRISEVQVHGVSCVAATRPRLDRRLTPSVSTKPTKPTLCAKLNDETQRSFCGSPSSIQSHCFFDPQRSWGCPAVTKKLERSLLQRGSWVEIATALRNHSDVACTLPSAFGGFTDGKHEGGHVKYLTAYGYTKHFEFDCLHEQRVLLGQQPLRDQRTACNTNQCPSEQQLGDVSLTAHLNITRILDVGGGSCSLDEWLGVFEASRPVYKRLSIMAHEPGYSCVFPFMCSERGTPSVAGGWLDKPGLHVPAESMDMVFHAQGLHHTAPGSDRATYFTIFDTLDRPLRPGGWLHLSDGVYPGQSDWMVYLLEWAAKHKYTMHRKQLCKHRQFLFQKPAREGKEARGASLTVPREELVTPREEGGMEPREAGLFERAVAALG